MASTDPTINSLTLSTAGTHTEWSPPPPRVTMSRLPSVDGDYVARYGHGGPTCVGRGVLRSTTEALLRAAVRTIQQGTNHEPATYTDADAATFANCILMDYRILPGSKPEKEDDTSWWVDVVFTVIQQVAT